jgi:lipopolysaccharide/colanic/teichoic acid biosynthesis glycosyltransferase
MEQKVYIERPARKTGAGTVSVDGCEAGVNRSAAILFEQPLNCNAHAIESFEVPLIQSPTLSVFTELLVRGLDITGSCIMLLLAAPVMVITAILVKYSSAGHVLYNQKRVGRAGKIFTLYKFRTMVEGAENETGPVWAAKDDERVTPVGKFLRCTRLDELPQLLNVLRGDMSLVGPRPERPYFVKQHKVLQGVRLVVKPGITGLAQVRAFYDLKPEHKLKYDYLYIRKRSLFLNLYILLQTVPVIFLKRGW